MFPIRRDPQYQDGKFIEALRERAVSQRKRKLIERVFGWSKLDRGLRQVKVRRLKRVDWFYRLVVTAYNLTRMRRLIVPFPQPAVAYSNHENALSGCEDIGSSGNGRFGQTEMAR